MPPTPPSTSPPLDHPLARFLRPGAERVLVADRASLGLDGATLPAVEGGYDAIVLDGVLAIAGDLRSLFTRARSLLGGERSRVVLSDEVHDPREQRRVVGGRPAREIEAAIHAAGFFVEKHETPPAFRAVARDDVPWPARDTSVPTDAPADAAPDASHGRETWVLRPGLSIRNYHPGDEKHIVPLFEEVFGETRSLAHWKWKFADSPFGATRASSAWDGDEMVAHYGGYVVPFWMDGKIRPALHAGDTMIRQSHRGFGRGKNSLLAQMVRQFETQSTCGQVLFGYGFSTGTHLKLGQLFLGYGTPVEIHVRTLDGEALRTLASRSRAADWRRGFTVRRTRRAGAWADVVFRRARFSLGWAVARTREYLRWRYEKHPDHVHDFFVVYEWGIPCGWWLARANGNTIEVGDAMFRSRSRGAAAAGMAALLRAYRKDGVDIDRVTGWMSTVPEWWNRDLDGMGFRCEREPTWMELIVKPCVADVEPGPFDRHFYYTQGDSDMY